MLNVIKNKLLSERTSGVPPVIFQQWPPFAFVKFHRAMYLTRLNVVVINFSYKLVFRQQMDWTAILPSSYSCFMWTIFIFRLHLSFVWTTLMFRVDYSYHYRGSVLSFFWNISIFCYTVDYICVLCGLFLHSDYISIYSSFV